jgi:phosphoglycolate phosphatase-like HAD superfamily hydrolase
MDNNTNTEKHGISDKLIYGMIAQIVLVAAALAISVLASVRSHELRRTIVYVGQALTCLLIIIFGVVKFKDRDRTFLRVILNCYAFLEALRAVLIITTGIAPVVAGITRLILILLACTSVLLSERLDKKDSAGLSIYLVVLEVVLYLVFLLGFPGVLYGRINRFIPLSGVLIAGSIALFTIVKNQQLGTSEDGSSFPKWVSVIATVLSGILIVVALGSAGMRPAGSSAPGSDALSLWTDSSETKVQLTEYMKAITDINSPDYIPTDKRVAVFDMDGTLISETNPIYFDHSLLLYRVLQDPDYADRASDFEKETAQKILEGIRAGEYPKGMDMMHGQAVASAFAGMTVDEFTDYVLEFREQDAPGYDGMTRADSFYKPMLEIVDYLQANGFTVYIVSGTDRLITRGIVQGKIDIPMSQAIGSDETIVSSSQGGQDGLDFQFDAGDELILGGDFVTKNLKMNKVAVIAQEIGVQPVLSFGNSTGDSSMADYVINNNPYRSMAFMLCCDDLEREYGNETKAQNMKDLCAEHGWIPISMRDDWTTIYGDGVTKNPDKGLDFYYEEH